MMLIKIIDATKEQIVCINNCIDIKELYLPFFVKNPNESYCEKCAKKYTISNNMKYKDYIKYRLLKT